MIEKYNLTSNVDIMTNVSEKHLLKIYSKAHFLLMPSLYEGFGLPVLEAMSRKCIPLVSNKGALLEITNNPKLILKLDLDSWINKISEIWNNKDKLLKIQKFCIEHSSEFTWQKYLTDFKSTIKYHIEI